MNKQKLPTQEELARLAALVFPVCREQRVPPNTQITKYGPRNLSREEASVMLAARLWLYAGEYSEKIEQAVSASNKGILGRSWVILDGLPCLKSSPGWEGQRSSA